MFTRDSSSSSLHPLPLFIVKGLPGCLSVLGCGSPRSLVWTVARLKLFKLLVYHLFCLFFPYHKTYANSLRAFWEIIAQKENISYL